MTMPRIDSSECKELNTADVNIPNGPFKFYESNGQINLSVLLNESVMFKVFLTRIDNNVSHFEIAFNEGYLKGTLFPVEQFSYLRGSLCRGKIIDLVLTSRECATDKEQKSYIYVTDEIYINKYSPKIGCILKKLKNNLKTMWTTKKDRANISKVFNLLDILSKTP